MKKLLLTLGVLMLVLAPLAVSAGTTQGSSGFLGGASETLKKGGEAAYGSGASTDLPTQVGRVINVVIGFLGVVLIIIIIRGGMLYMTAGGNTDQVAKAKSWIINGIIGLVIIMLAYAISSFVISRLSQAAAGTTFLNYYLT